MEKAFYCLYLWKPWQVTSTHCTIKFKLTICPRKGLLRFHTLCLTEKLIQEDFGSLLKSRKGFPTVTPALTPSGQEQVSRCTPNLKKGCVVQFYSFIHSFVCLFVYAFQ